MARQGTSLIPIAAAVISYSYVLECGIAPDKIAWAHENRGARLRVCGTPGDASAHVENRAGEPTANPYLYLASQVAAGLDGMERGLELEPPVTEAYLADRPALPASLMEAVGHLRSSALFAEAFGPQVIEYLLTVKQSEIDRFLQAVTDWEHTEYFEVY